MIFTAPFEISSVSTNLTIALMIGIGFGFALEQAGFSSSRKLVGMFYGYDTTVLKVFFTAALVALLGSQVLSYFGLLDMSLVFVNHYFVWPTIVGGIIMGAGFIIGGFCPGTGFSAMAIGKIDALFYLLGGLVGAFIFAELYPIISGFANSSARGPVKINEWFGISTGLFAFILMVVASAMFWLSEVLEKRYAQPEISKEV